MKSGPGKTPEPSLRESRLTIEPYSPGAFDACLDIFKGNQEPYFAESERALFEAFLMSEALTQPYFVVLADDAAVACGGFYRDGGVIHLNWGMVRRDVHGRGLGRFLLEYRLARIKEAYPDRPVRIDTSQHTAGFYQRFGFAIVSIERGGYARGLDKVNMEKRANQAPRSAPVAAGH